MRVRFKINYYAIKKDSIFDIVVVPCHFECPFGILCPGQILLHDIISCVPPSFYETIPDMVDNETSALFK